MESLEELARKEFPDLSEAEKKVFEHAAKGIVADCCLGGDSDPEKANGTLKAPNEKWPETRNVRADLIRWLCVDCEARKQVDPRGVWILGARITGALDLSFANVLFPLVLFRCRLERDLDLKSAKMPVLSLEGSWTGAIVADGLKLEGDIFLTSGFRSEGRVRLLGATIGGDLSAEGGTFNNSGGDALNADRIEVTGSVFLRNGFHAEGEVRLLGATIGGSLSAVGGSFKNSNGDALSADGIKVTGSVLLRSGFSAEGTVRLVGATIGGLEAAEGTFKSSNGNAVNADRIKVIGSVFLGNGFSAAGPVRLAGAEIMSQLAVVNAGLDELNLESAHITGPFHWQNINNEENSDSPSKEWKPTLNLTDAKVGLLVDQEASWPDKGRLRLDGFIYDRIAAGLAHAQVSIDATARLRWLGLQPDEYGYLPQPYEQLIAVLRRMGHEHQVAEVAIAKKLDLRERGGLGRWAKFWSWFQYRTVRYGYEPWRAFIWILLLIVLGNFVFSSAHYANVLVPSDKDAYAEYEKSKMEKLPAYYPDFHAPFYSLDVVLPFDLGQKSSWRLIERWPGDHAYWGYEFYSIAQLFIGWVLLIVAAAVPAGLIKKD